MVNDAQRVKGYREVQASWIRKKIENSEPVNYDNVIIDGDLNLDGLNLVREYVDREFKEEFFGVSGELAIISSLIKIINSTIDGKVDLQNAKFEDTVYFNNIEFTKFCDFSGSQFDKPADFIKAKFNKDADFSKIDFHDDVTFVDSLH